MAFTHLHVHTQYSLLEGAIQTDVLFDRVKAMGMDSIAITDSHNLFGAIDFYLKAKDAGIKPIIGCEIYYAPSGRAGMAQAATGQGGPAAQNVAKFHHLVLLCKDLNGYKNLCQLVTRSYTENAIPEDASKAAKKAAGPRALVDRDLLDKWGDGLVVLSGCLRGELSYKVLDGRERSGARVASLVQETLWRRLLSRASGHVHPRTGYRQRAASCLGSKARRQVRRHDRLPLSRAQRRRGSRSPSVHRARQESRFRSPEEPGAFGVLPQARSRHARAFRALSRRVRQHAGGRRQVRSQIQVQG